MKCADVRIESRTRRTKIRTWFTTALYILLCKRRHPSVVVLILMNSAWLRWYSWSLNNKGMRCLYWELINALMKMSQRQRVSLQGDKAMHIQMQFSSLMQAELKFLVAKNCKQTWQMKRISLLTANIAAIRISLLIKLLSPLRFICATSWRIRSSHLEFKYSDVHKVKCIQQWLIKSKHLSPSCINVCRSSNNDSNGGHPRCSGEKRKWTNWRQQRKKVDERSRMFKYSNIPLSKYLPIRLGLFTFRFWIWHLSSMFDHDKAERTDRLCHPCLDRWTIFVNLCTSE